VAGIPGQARAVIIGAGIVGNSLAYHLAKLGWRDLVLIDKGPMPNPGGSTGHASNFIFPIEYNKMMMELTRDSTEQYKQLGVFIESGGIEVARTPERMVELRRRTTAAKAWGIPFELLDPAGVRELVPYLDDSVILGGASFPSITVGTTVFAVSYHATASSFTGGNDIALLAVPEPNSAAVLIAGLGSLVGLQRFRRRR